MITPTITQPKAILQPKPAKAICQHCGHVSTADDPVEHHWHHIGGQGDVRILECTILPNCWRRVDLKAEIQLDEAKAKEHENQCRRYSRG